MSVKSRTKMHRESTVRWLLFLCFRVFPETDTTYSGERRKQRLALLERLLNAKDTQTDSQVALQAAEKSLQDEDVPDTPAPSDFRPLYENAVSGISRDSAAVGFATSTFGNQPLNYYSPLPMTQSDDIVRMTASQSTADAAEAAWPTLPVQRPAFSGGILATAYPTISEPTTALQQTYSGSPIGINSPLNLDQSRVSSSQEQERRDESLQSFFNNLMSISVPDVKQVIYVRQNGLFGAVMENTLALGLLNGAQMIFSQDGTSPFNKDWIETKGDMQLSEIKTKFAATPRDLQPLDIQITFEHHVYLDVLPFPMFRDKALKALTCDPPLFDEDELCVDITVNAGLVVWGSQGNDQGMEACRPWDMRSWEPKPWFLRKYWYLCGGWEDVGQELESALLD